MSREIKINSYLTTSQKLIQSGLKIFILDPKCIKITEINIGRLHRTQGLNLKEVFGGGKSSGKAPALPRTSLGRVAVLSTGVPYNLQARIDF